MSVWTSYCTDAGLNNAGNVRTFWSYAFLTKWSTFWCYGVPLTSQRTSGRTFWYYHIISDVMTYFVDLMNKQYSLKKANNINFWHPLNLFIYILTRALAYLAISEYWFIWFAIKSSCVCMCVRACVYYKYVSDNGIGRLQISQWIIILQIPLDKKSNVRWIYTTHQKYLPDCPKLIVRNLALIDLCVWLLTFPHAQNSCEINPFHMVFMICNFAHYI